MVGLPLVRLGCTSTLVAAALGGHDRLLAASASRASRHRLRAVAMVMRVHQDRNKRGEQVPWAWTCCQDAECPEDHRLYYPFHGIGPVVGKWEGIKH